MHLSKHHVKQSEKHVSNESPKKNVDPMPAPIRGDSPRRGRSIQALRWTSRRRGRRPPSPIAGADWIAITLQRLARANHRGRNSPQESSCTTPQDQPPMPAIFGEIIHLRLDRCCCVDKRDGCEGRAAWPSADRIGVSIYAHPSMHRATGRRPRRSFPPPVGRWPDPVVGKSSLGKVMLKG